MKVAIPGLLAVVLLGTMAAASAYTLEGEVFAFESGAIPYAGVDPWVQLPGGAGYSYWSRHGPLWSDALGHFEAPKVPFSHVSVLAFADGYVQPCAVTRHVRADVSVRVELMPVSAFDVVTAPRPQLAVEPSESGVIFETTATGRQPVVGARVWLVDVWDNILANTMSDRSGGYFVCNVDDLPTAAWLTVTKDGFESHSVGPVNSSESAVIDIELMRIPPPTLSLNKLTVAGGCQSVIGKLQLAKPAPAGGRIIPISDTLTAAITPASVTVPEGETEQTFLIRTTPVTTLEGGHVTATFPTMVRSQPLGVRPIGMLSVALVPTTVVGTNAVAATAKLECNAAPGPITVNLASSDPAIANPVAASIVVPQGLQSAPFDVATSKVLSRKTVAIYGSTAKDRFGGQITKSRILTVTPASFVNPNVLSFGTVPVGTTSGPRATTLINKGTTSFTVESISITGPNPLAFVMTENCPAILAAGASCSINVRFKPTAATSRVANLSIATSARAVPLIVSLAGTGT